MKIRSIDHIVLTVNNMEDTIKFYTEVLKMELITFGEGRKALLFGEQKINLHPKENYISPIALHPTCGAIDLCLITDTPIEKVRAELISHNIEIVEGIVPRTGAIGKILSIYIKDPDENLIELSNYVSQ